MPCRCWLSEYSSKKRSTRSSISPTRPRSMPFRTMARCLRGIASRFASTVGKQFLAESDVKILARPLGLGGAAIAQFEMADAQIRWPVPSPLRAAPSAPQRRDRLLLHRPQTAATPAHRRTAGCARAPAGARRPTLPPAPRRGNEFDAERHPRSGRATRRGGRRWPPGTRPRMRTRHRGRLRERDAQSSPVGRRREDRADSCGFNLEHPVEAIPVEVGQKPLQA